MKQKILSTVLLLLFLTAGQLFSQNRDYEAFPKIDLVPEHLDAEISVDEQKQVRGDIEYSMRMLISRVDSIVFDAERMQIEDVMVNERTVDFELADNKLVIFPDENLESGSMVTIRVIYTTEPSFGLHRNYMGTIFTSGLPKSSRHWLPGIDHPGVSFTTDFKLTHPSGTTAFVTGRKESTGIASVDAETTRYRSRFPVSPADLFFAAGDLETSTRQVSPYTIHIHSEMRDVDEDIKEAIFDQSFRLLNQLSSLTGADYPHSDLHFLIVNDNAWETRNYASGVVTITGRDNALEQAHFGLIGQWSGILAKTLNWSEPEALNIMTGYLAMMTNYPADAEASEPLLQTEEETIYEAFSPREAAAWIGFIESNPRFGYALETSFRDFFREPGTQYNWYDAARLMYKRTGQPFMDPPEFEMPVPEIEPEYHYTVELIPDEAEGSVAIRFTAENEAVEELVSVTAAVIDFSETRTRNLDFTGREDEVVISVPAGIENINLTIADRDDITLTEKKPFMFWIYQIQNDNNPDRRRDAAKGLQDYTENPDLQLALLDVLNIETHPEVYAEIIKTLSKVTDGASGTEQIFLERADSGRPEMVQLATVYALSAYHGNQQVISRLRSLARGSEFREVRLQSLESLSKVVDSGAFKNITETLMLDDRLINEVPIMLNLLAEKGEAENAVRYSETFLSREFPPQIRLQVFDLIHNYDSSASSWKNRIQNLLADHDPRIRYRAAQSLHFLQTADRAEITRKFIPEEYDERVLRVMQNN